MDLVNCGGKTLVGTLALHRVENFRLKLARLCLCHGKNCHNHACHFVVKAILCCLNNNNNDNNKVKTVKNLSAYVMNRKLVRD